MPSRLIVRGIKLDRPTQAPLGAGEMAKLGLHDTEHACHATIVGGDVERALQLRLGVGPAPRREVEMRQVDERLQIALVTPQRPAEELLGLCGIAGARLVEQGDGIFMGVELIEQGAEPQEHGGIVRTQRHCCQQLGTGLGDAPRPHEQHAVVAMGAGIVRVQRESTAEHALAFARFAAVDEGHG